MGGGFEYPLRSSSHNTDNLSKAATHIQNKIVKKSQKLAEDDPRGNGLACHNQGQQESQADPKSPQVPLRSWNKQEHEEIQRRNIRGDEFAMLVDRYLAGEEVADILASIPKQPLLALTREEEGHMYRVEMAARVKLPLPDADDEDW